MLHSATSDGILYGKKTSLVTASPPIPENLIIPDVTEADFSKRYRILRTIGQGEFAKVKLAEDVRPRNRNQKVHSKHDDFIFKD